MKHRLFNLAAATSLLLCLACVLMWLRSGFAHDWAERHRGSGRMCYFSSLAGSLHFVTLRRTELRGEGPGRPWVRVVVPLEAAAGKRPTWEFPKWAHYETGVLPAGRIGGPLGTAPSAGPACEYAWVRMPYWLLTLITGTLPVLWFWRRRREKRLSRRGFEVLPAPAAKTGS